MNKAIGVIMKKQLSGIIFFSLLLSLTCTGYAANKAAHKKNFILVAHRGGVVDEERSENSLKALDEAVRRGYTHVEVDAAAPGRPCSVFPSQQHEERDRPGRQH
jgi:hypothetical protein